MVCIKFDQKIKKPKFWTFQVFKVFLKNLKNLDFFRTHFLALDTSDAKSVWTGEYKVPPTNTILQLSSQPPRMTLSPQTPHPQTGNFISRFLVCVSTDMRDSYPGDDYKKAKLPQRWPRDAPYIWVPRKFLGIPWVRPRLATLPEIFNGLLFRSILWMCTQSLKYVAFPVPEIIGGTLKTLGSPWIRPHSLFFEIFNGLLFGSSDGPRECAGQIWSP